MRANRFRSWNYHDTRSLQWAEEKITKLIENETKTASIKVDTSDMMISSFKINEYLFPTIMSVTCRISICWVLYNYHRFISDYIQHFWSIFIHHSISLCCCRIRWCHMPTRLGLVLKLLNCCAHNKVPKHGKNHTEHDLHIITIENCNTWDAPVTADARFPCQNIHEI